MAPGACWGDAHRGHPPSRRGTGRGVLARPASGPLRASGGSGKRSREDRASELKLGPGEPAPSVGFKRPLSARKSSKRQAAPEPGPSLVHGAAWPSFPHTAAFARPNVRSPLCHLPLIRAQNASKCLQGRAPNWKTSLRSPEHPHAYRRPFCSTLNNGLSASLCTPQ